MNNSWGPFNNISGFGVKSDFGSGNIGKIFSGSVTGSLTTGVVSESSLYRWGLTNRTNNNEAFISSMSLVGSNGSGLIAGNSQIQIGKVTTGAITQGIKIKQDSIIAFNGSNSTQYPFEQPASAASFWEHATDGTGSYKTPGAMTVVNPLGGSNTLQASLDSLEQSQNQIIVAADSFYVDDGTIVYLVQAGDTITLPTGGGGGNGIYGGSDNIPAATTATATGNFTIATVSADEGIAWTADSVRVYGSAASVRVGSDLAIHDGTGYGTTGQVMTAGSGIEAEWTDAGTLPVTNPAGGTNTLQAALDSLYLPDGSGTWLKPELEAGDVTINSSANTLIFNSNNSGPGFYETMLVNVANKAAGLTQNVLSINESGGQYFSLGLSSGGYNISTGSASTFRISTGIGSGGTYKEFAMSNTSTGIGNEAFHFSQVGKGAELRLNVSADTSQYVSIKSPDSGVTKWKMTLPATAGGNGQFLQTNGSGTTTWASPGTSGGGTISEYDAFSYTTAVTPVQMCYTDYDKINNVSTSGCLGGAADIVNVSGAERTMLVLAHGSISNAGAANWIDVEVFVQGVASGVKQLIFVPAGGTTSFSVNGNVGVLNNERVDIRLRPGRGGSAATFTVENITLTANYAY
jgi:hypothetical protein